MLADTFFHRHLTVFPPEKAQTPLTIIGTGAVGSMAALALAKIGFSDLTLFDPDIVETENVPPQLFTPAQVGESKVGALSATLKLWADIEAKQQPTAWDFESWQETPLVVVAVDSMATRKTIYEKLRERFGVRCMIEARMAVEMLRLYAIRPSDPDAQRRYEKTLYSDKEASAEKCTEKAIAYNTFVIGGLIASLLKHEAMGEPVPFELVFRLSDYALLKTP